MDDLPPLVTQTTFMPPADFDAPARPQRARQSRKQPEGHIPRPPNAFILFRSSFIRSQRVSSEVETSHSTLSKIIGLTWQNLPEDERRIWHDKARQGAEEHRRRFPAYSFRPLHRGGAGKDAKRKVRDPGIDDPVRCEKIAELLVEGKHGSELNAAVKEFDKHRVSNIVARFEPPITATTYCRSSSAPAPDTEPPTGFLRNASAVLPQRRRSSSSSPPSRHPSETNAPLAEHQTPALENIDYAPDNFVSPWALEPEADYLVSISVSSSQSLYSTPSEDFTGLTFLPSGLALPELTCDPLWMVPHNQQSTPDFQLQAEPDTSIAAFIAQDWARMTQPFSTQCMTYPSSRSGYELCTAEPEQPYIAHPMPHTNIDNDLAQLMADYSPVEA
jgi:hypothetical protein